MSTLNGSVFRKNVSRSVYSDSQYAERTNGYATPKPTMAHLDVPRAPSRARSPNSANYLEVPRAPSRARSPGGEVVTQVDPTLEDAQKAGNNYHITMSLNAALADAGISGSAIMSGGGRASQMEIAGGRASQMEYATMGSRSQGTEYGGSGSRSVSRIDVHGGGMPIPAPRMTQSDHGGRVSVVQVDGAARELAVGRATTATPSLVASYSASTRRDVVSVNGGGYTIKSVQPSAARKEVVETTVERTSGSGNNTVGFDLELFGGQTTTIKEETTDAAATAARSGRSGISTLTKSSRDIHGGGGGGGGRGRGAGGGGGSSSWETSYTRHRHHVSDDDDRERPAKSGKTRTLKTTVVEHGRDTPDFGSVANEDDEDLNYTEFTRNVSIQRPNAGIIGGGMKRGLVTNGPRGTRGVNSYETTEVETVVERQRPTGSPQDGRNPWLLHGADNDETDQSWAIYRQLVKGAGPGTVHQRVYVEKDEDDIVEDGPQIKDMLNVDTVSEKVLVFVGNNIAEMTIKVRTERIVPIKGSNNMFRKSAVTVNRIIEVDMMATYERQSIYENVLDRQRTSGRDLNQKETFDLYKAFLRLAEEDAGDAARDQVQIDKTTDEAQLEELKRASNFYEKRDSFDAGTSNSLGQSRGFNSTNRSASRFRESRINEYGNDDSEFSSAIY